MSSSGGTYFLPQSCFYNEPFAAGSPCLQCTKSLTPAVVRPYTDRWKGEARGQGLARRPGEGKKAGSL